MIGSGTMTRINEIFLELNKIIYVSTTSFSVEYLEKSPSYFRTIRYGSSDVPIEVYVCLLENLDKKLHELRLLERCRMSKALATKINTLIEGITKELIKDFMGNFRSSERALGVFLPENETFAQFNKVDYQDDVYGIPPIIFDLQSVGD